MKTIRILATLLFLVFTKLWAQPYQSIFGSDSTRWHVNYDFSLASGFKTFIAIKPTYFNNKLYQLASIGVWGIHKFYIKEDTLNGKVWACKHPDSTMQLVMDFALNEGDTFTIQSELQSIRKLIVDSTAVINGRKWIFFPKKDTDGNYIYSTDQIPFFIEGIGTNFSYMMNIANDGYGYDYLICAYKNGIEQTDYQNVTFNGSCDIGSISTFESTLSQFKCYPNPLHDVLYLDYLPIMSHTICIYDVLGRKVLSVENTKQQYHINMQHFASGTYIVQVRLKNNALQSFKVVKN